MRGHERFDAAKGVQSLLDWWSLAGVEEALLDDPRPWLRRVADQAPVEAAFTPGSSTPRAPQPAIVAPPPVAYPDTLEGFTAWLSQADGVPEAHWPGNRILPTGSASPALMVIVDMPEAHDADRLMSGDEGRLFDAMLRALGESRETVHLASLAMARPAGGILDDPETAQLVGRMRHHISLVKPHKLLILGDRTAKAMAVSAVHGKDDNLRAVNHEGGTILASATHHPRFLLRHPMEKRAAWTAMKKLIEDAA